MPILFSYFLRYFVIVRSRSREEDSHETRYVTKSDRRRPPDVCRCVTAITTAIVQGLKFYIDESNRKNRWWWCCCRYWREIERKRSALKDVYGFAKSISTSESNEFSIKITRAFVIPIRYSLSLFARSRSDKRKRLPLPFLRFRFQLHILCRRRSVENVQRASRIPSTRSRVRDDRVGSTDYTYDLVEVSSRIWLSRVTTSQRSSAAAQRHDRES